MGDMMPGPNTLTLLLADVEGSVRQWETDREAAASAMARLDQQVLQAAARHAGARPLGTRSTAAHGCARWLTAGRCLVRAPRTTSSWMCVREAPG